MQRVSWDSEPHHGSALVAHAAAELQTAADTGSYTQRLLAYQRRHPELSLDETVRRMANDRHVAQESDYAEIGTPSSSTSGRKVGVYVANRQYAHVSRLPGALADGSAMQQLWSSRGYLGGLSQDRTASQMIDAFDAAASDLGPGDEMVFYYAGHGTPVGALGVRYAHSAAGASRGIIVKGLPSSGHAPSSPAPAPAPAPAPMPDDVLTHSTVVGWVNLARTKGFHLTVIFDSCHSGAVVDEALNARVDELKADAQTPEVQQLLAVSEDLHHLHADLLDLFREPSQPKRQSRGDDNDRGFSTISEAAYRAKVSARLEALRVRVARCADRYAELTHGDDRLQLIVPHAESWLALDHSRTEDIVAEMQRTVLGTIEHLVADP